MLSRLTGVSAMGPMIVVSCGGASRGMFMAMIIMVSGGIIVGQGSASAALVVPGGFISSVVCETWVISTVGEVGTLKVVIVPIVHVTIEVGSERAPSVTAV